MDHIVLLFVTSGVALLVAVALSVTCGHRRRARPVEEALPEARSLIHVLRNEEELQVAVRRATQFDRGIADMLRTRADRYERLIARAPVTEMPASRRLKAEGVPHQHPHSA